jgi:hypothetical protein
VPYPYGEIEYDVVAADAYAGPDSFTSASWREKLSMGPERKCLPPGVLILAPATDQIAHDFVLADLRVSVKSSAIASTPGPGQQAPAAFIARVNHAACIKEASPIRPRDEDGACRG